MSVSHLGETARAAPVRWLILLALLVPLGLALLGWRLAPPMLNPDSAMGFLAWEAHAAGAPWNTLRAPDPAHLARDRDEFLTWWSPGQHDLTGPWRRFGANWGQAIVLTTVVACWIQLAGCWQLARSLGGSRAAAAWLGAASVLQWHSLFSFGHFRGGDVLLGAATPWMVAVIWRVRARPVWYLAVIPVLIWGGQYLKLSAILLTGPLLLAGGLGHLWSLRRRPAFAVTWSVTAAALAAGSWWLFQIAFLNRGPTPGAGGSLSGDPLSLVAYAAAAPWLAATGFGSLVGHLYWWLGRDVDGLWRTGGWFVAPLTAGVWWLTARRLFPLLGGKARHGAIVVLGTGCAILALLYLRGAPVGLDDRYMRPTAVVLLLALALAVDSRPANRSWLPQLALGAIAVFGVGCAVQRTIALLQHASRGREGIIQQHLTPRAIAHLAEIDAAGAPRSKLIYVPFAGLAFEIRRQRVIVADDLGVERQHLWHGRVPELIVALPDVMEQDGRGARVRARYADYRPDEWTSERQGGWYFWSVRTPSS